MKKYLGFLGLLSLLSFNPVFASQDVLPQQALSHMPVCPPGASDSVARCHAQVVTNQSGKPNVTSSPTGLTPDQLHSAYNLPNTAGTNRIIAIVDAYDDPTALADLNTFSAQFGLPSMSACSGAIANSSTACFSKINQNGTSSLPSVNGGWALEISLDVQTAHAICQDCSILLVEANSSSYSNLMAAVDRAVLSGAKIISNSYGSSEFSGESSFDYHFNKTGYAFTFSSGDSGYGTSYPAASPYVTSVGGTTLNMNGQTYVSESVWSGTGSGCSALEVKPAFQHDSGCLRRTIGDVSAVANPNTGMSVYDSTPYNGSTGWFQVGGTSLSSPLIAAVYALAGGVPTGVMGNSMPYAAGANSYLHDVTSGSNGNCTRGRKSSGSAYLCTAGPGYDGPSGLGTPKTAAAF